MLANRGSSLPVASCSYRNANASFSGALKNGASLSKKSYLASLGLPSQTGESPCALHVLAAVSSNLI